MRRAIRATGKTETPAEIRSYLEPGEELLWTGYGAPRRIEMLFLVLGGLAFCMVPIALFLGFFQEFYNTDFHPVPAPVLFAFAVICVALLSAGAYVIINGLYYIARWPAVFVYALTNRRVLIVDRRRALTIFLREVEEIGLEEERDGVGTIRFGKDKYIWESDWESGWKRDWKGDWEGHRSHHSMERLVKISAPRFIRIPGAMRVYRLIQKVKADLEGAEPGDG